MLMEKSTEKKKTSDKKKQFSKVFTNQKLQKKALKGGATEKNESGDVSKVINGVRKLKVEASTRTNSKSAPGKAKMEESGKLKISCSCKPCGKGPFGSVEEADAHYKTGKHRGKSAVFTHLAGAEKVLRG